MSIGLQASIEYGKRLLAAAKATLGDQWDALGPDDQEAAREIALDFVALQAQAFAGRDVARELTHVHAQLAGLSEPARRALVGAWQQIRDEVGAFLGAAARGFLGGALGGPAGAALGAVLGGGASPSP